MRLSTFKKLALIAIILAAIATWCFAIFQLSDMDSTDSNDTSTTIVEQSILKVFDITNEYEITNAHLNKENIAFAVALVNAPLRKLAHATVYCILAILLLAISRIIFSHRKYLLSCFVVLGLCLAFALTDEYHQLFVDGRTGQMLDVIIDFIGASIGTIIFSSYYLIWQKGRRSGLRQPTSSAKSPSPSDS